MRCLSPEVRRTDFRVGPRADAILWAWGFGSGGGGEPPAAVRPRRPPSVARARSGVPGADAADGL